MTATKKLVVILILALFGVVGTAAYLYQDVPEVATSTGPAVVVVATDPPGAVISAAPTDPEDQRQAFIADLRQAVLARSDEPIVIPGAEALADDRMTVESLLEGDEAGGFVASTRTVQWCDATVIESNFIATWPEEPVVPEVREGARVFTYTPTVVASGSSAVRTLAQFPLRPAQLPSGGCLKHGYIGVTMDGRLIHNNDLILYANRLESDLIGYAFDGNPIYGTVADASSIDQCGGREVGGIYRYQLRTDEDFILSCFVSPANQVPLL